MAHNDLEARIQASNLMLSLLRIFSHCPEDSHKKEFLIQNYDLIRTAINVLKNESSERVSPILLDIITLSVTRHFALDVQDYSAALNKMEDFSNVEFSYLD